MQPDIRNDRRTAEFVLPASFGAAEDFQPFVSAEISGPADPDSTLFINRELSLLAFQWRVFEEAKDESNPILERVRFISILGANLEEFFMVRVAGLKRQIESASTSAGPDGLSPSQQLHAISSEVATLLASAQECLETSLLPALRQNGILLVSFSDLDDEQKERLRLYFLKKIFPVLTPLAFDPGHPFPHISNLCLNLAIQIRDGQGQERFARLKVPDSLPQLISIDSSETGDDLPELFEEVERFIWLDDLIKANLSELFPGMEILGAHPFHIIRDAEVEIQELEAGDLLEKTEEGIRQRRFGDVVGLQVQSLMPAPTLEILIENLQIQPSDVYQIDGRVPLSAFKHIASIDRPDLKYPPFLPSVPSVFNQRLSDEIVFSAISKRDILLHHPFDSFQPVVNFLNQAADDANVMAIKMTLYRVGKNSPVVEALLRASRKGKQVAVLVELKARFDEESNVEWARALEAEGVHVVYGLPGLKCHSKLALVVRREGDSIVRYVHLGTGNYNPGTAQVYTDLGLFTRDQQIGTDVSDIFNYLTGYSDKKEYEKLLVAPINLRKRFEDLIKREIEHQRAGRDGRIIFKMNSLVDERIIKLLYEASQAGVSIDLIVRGICCLRPGIPGVSENIRVTSVVGRFLEHSRIYYFRNGGEECIYCGSADLMPRNLDRRVEVIFPIDDDRLADYIHRDVLGILLADNVKARKMQADTTYLRQPAPAEPFCSQAWFLANATANKQK
jgi:polyphosphate kinase